VDPIAGSQRLRTSLRQSLGWFVLRRLRWALVALVVLFVVATTGYVVIEHVSWLDASFMSVITLSTVGYNEVRPLNGAGKVFTMLVIVASFGTFVYAATTVTELFTSGSPGEHLRESRARKMRSEMAGHVIVIGFGRVGQAVAQGLADVGVRCVVMDRNPALEPVIREAGFVPMIGDATDETDLSDAGIYRARALVAAAEQDDINLVITLTARALRPDLRIVSRVNESGWIDRIMRAGADVVQSPYPSYGLSLANSALSPQVLDFHPLPLLGLGAEEIEILSGSALIGLRLAEIGARHPGVHVVGLRRDSHLHRWTDVVDGVKRGDVWWLSGPRRLCTRWPTAPPPEPRSARSPLLARSEGGGSRDGSAPGAAGGGRPAIRFPERWLFRSSSSRPPEHEPPDATTRRRGGARVPLDARWIEDVVRSGPAVGSGVLAGLGGCLDQRRPKGSGGWYRRPLAAPRSCHLTPRAREQGSTRDPPRAPTGSADHGDRPPPVRSPIAFTARDPPVVPAAYQASGPSR
jgi:voltage-gated potassium channel